MSKFELKLPRMGESVAEATLTTWLKEIGDTIELDEPIFEIATDKVDSEVPSEVEGVLLEKRFEVDDIIKVGQTVAVIEIKGENSGVSKNTKKTAQPTEPIPADKAVAKVEKTVTTAKETAKASERHPEKQHQQSERFYSPLVKNIARQEGIPVSELDAISGSGMEGRVTKADILEYVSNGSTRTSKTTATPVENTDAAVLEDKAVSDILPSSDQEVIKMTRTGKLIAQHMVESVSTSAHVQSFVEVDVTGIVNWRNSIKKEFEKREGERLTFTPIFLEAVAKALKKFPMMNISVVGDTVVKKKNINIGMAAALPNGNLIVPVIKNADQLNLVGMAKAVNDLASRARGNRLKPDEVREGTYTVTNVGTFGSVFGTPIINQPQVGILALGAIRKLPAVIETKDGDFIGIRSKMYLSHSYDHRVVNGALGSMFVKAVADYLEAWDVHREV